jgi:hypothetical protein
MEAFKTSCIKMTELSSALFTLYDLGWAYTSYTSFTDGFLYAILEHSVRFTGVTRQPKTSINKLVPAFSLSG